MADIPQSNDSSAAPVTTPALPKSPVADTTPNNNLNPLSASDVSGLTGKPAEPSTDTASGDTAAPSTNLGTPTAPIVPPTNEANGNGTKNDSALSEDTKQTDAPGAAVMTGALPASGDQNNVASSLSDKPAESAEKDGVEDVAGASTVPKDTTAPPSGDTKDASTGSNPSASSTGAPSAANGADKVDTNGPTDLVSEEKPSNTTSNIAPAADEDVEMKDAPAPSATETASALASAPPAAGADISGLAGATAAPTTTPALAAPATVATEAAGEKRKAATDDVEEPEAKKRKGAFSKVIDKAKSAVQDVKEKAKPGRKPGSKAKKEAVPPPVGRTERKTRSQARSG